VDEPVGASECSTSSRRTASQRSERTSSFRFFENDRKYRISATLPRQAKLLQGRLRVGGQAGQLPTMRSTTLSV
jgi:hypothetical protein